MVRGPLTIFGTPDLLSIFWRDEIDKLSQVVRLKIQKMKVTNCPESEEISIDLQVGDHRSLELKSLNYTKVFFVESKWNFQFQQSPKTKVVWPQILVDSQKIQFYTLLGFLFPPVLCKFFFRIHFLLNFHCRPFFARRPLHLPDYKPNSLSIFSNRFSTFHHISAFLNS